MSVTVFEKSEKVLNVTPLVGSAKSNVKVGVLPFDCKFLFDQ
jgi:hypothetical protein